MNLVQIQEVAGNADADKGQVLAALASRHDDFGNEVARAAELIRIVQRWLHDAEVLTRVILHEAFDLHVLGEILTPDVLLGAEDVLREIADLGLEAIQRAAAVAATAPLAVALAAARAEQLAAEARAAAGAAAGEVAERVDEAERAAAAARAAAGEAAERVNEAERAAVERVGEAERAAAAAREAERAAALAAAAAEGVDRPALEEARAAEMRVHETVGAAAARVDEAARAAAEAREAEARAAEARAAAREAAERVAAEAREAEARAAEREAAERVAAEAREAARAALVLADEAELMLAEARQAAREAAVRADEAERVAAEVRAPELAAERAEREAARLARRAAEAPGGTDRVLNLLALIPAVQNDPATLAVLARYAGPETATTIAGLADDDRGLIAIRTAAEAGAADAVLNLFAQIAAVQNDAATLAVLARRGGRETARTIAGLGAAAPGEDLNIAVQRAFAEGPGVLNQFNKNLTAVTRGQLDTDTQKLLQKSRKRPGT